MGRFLLRTVCPCRSLDISLYVVKRGFQSAFVIIQSFHSIHIYPSVARKYVDVCEPFVFQKSHSWPYGNVPSDFR